MKIKTDLETKGTFGPFIRYDLYKEIGAPEIKNLDDFLTVLKQMQDLTPQNEDGQNVYAISLFKDWDRSYMTMGMFATKMMGITMPDEALRRSIMIPVNPSLPPYSARTAVTCSLCVLLMRQIRWVFWIRTQQPSVLRMWCRR